MTTFYLEDLISLSEACKLLPSRKNRKFCTTTLWRWCKKGVNGVQLEHIAIGRCLYTTEEALMYFFHQLASKQARPDLEASRLFPNSSIGKVSKRKQRACSKLNKDGI